jgi:hypothetical protein
MVGDTGPWSNLSGLGLLYSAHRGQDLLDVLITERPYWRAREKFEKLKAAVFDSSLRADTRVIGELL